MRWKNVVLPAPFGPMIACFSPSSSSKSTPSMATKPPKCLKRSVVRSIGVGSVAARPVRGELPGEPARPSGRKRRMATRMTPSTIGQYSVYSLVRRSSTKRVAAPMAGPKNE